ncbi:hypothetical protein HMPREF9080_01639 [Cardiobacterium valvarum F0432]|uniref:Uncharacterized protein n=1 Tax=Cardiobacterium valvarum F0432 TaxID=797473 RepID=G9ZFU1_9GAMM|nr:hypothetical protein HMPREF9080_01639 [Cardiobacterium valvarum F0432]
MAAKNVKTVGKGCRQERKRQTAAKNCRFTTRNASRKYAVKRVKAEK